MDFFQATGHLLPMATTGPMARHYSFKGPGVVRASCWTWALPAQVRCWQTVGLSAADLHVAYASPAIYRDLVYATTLSLLHL